MVSEDIFSSNNEQVSVKAVLPCLILRLFGFTRYIFARFGGVMMNGGEEPGGGDWTCNPTGGGF